MKDAQQTKEWNGLEIIRLEDGGFMVAERSLLRTDDRFNFYPPMFACTTMKEALDYIKTKIGRGR